MVKKLQNSVAYVICLPNEIKYSKILCRKIFLPATKGVL
jgi:hypothetical protein